MFSSLGALTRSMAHVLLLSGASALLASAQSGADVCAARTHAVVLYAPESNLERREIETLHSAKVSVDIAMYSFTDRDLAEELVRLAKNGVRVRVYRDWREYEQEQQRGASTTEMLVAGGVQVRVKSSRDLMHFKSYVIDGTLLRTGSANWSPTGLKRQDNDVHYEMDSEDHQPVSYRPSMSDSPWYRSSTLRTFRRCGLLPNLGRSADQRRRAKAKR
jgi:phosphatidylserine/phosphatidylglycerophosphate/cardiolipin synthase-like enzyme